MRPPPVLCHIQHMKGGYWAIRWGSREVGRAATDEEALALADRFMDQKEATK